MINDACREIEDALRPEEGDTINVVKIIERGGLLHIFWEGTLSARARAEVERAIEQISNLHIHAKFAVTMAVSTPAMAGS